MATLRETCPRRTAKLCTRCRGLELLGSETFRALDFEDDWPALSSLEQSADAGCDFCRVICDSIKSDPGITALHRVRIVVRPAAIGSQPGQVLKLHSLRIFAGPPGVFDNRRIHNKRIPMPDELVRGTFLLCAQSSRNTVPMLSTPSIQVLSERNVDFVQKFIAESTESTEPEALRPPTRLLDLADLQSGSAKLLLSPGDHRPEEIRYAALSYCWGNADTAKKQSITTFSNQEDRIAGFQIKDLSPVIQDAIQVCSRIGIRYLWVDALCILQSGTGPHDGKDAEEAKKDWDTESQHLWEVFGGAYITICAASSTNCQESFLQDRSIQPGLLIKLRTADGCENGTDSTDPRESPACEIIPWPTTALASEYEGTDDHPFQPIILKSRWYSRGWVHQEIAFSKRLLVFGANMLYMRCAQFQACENGWRSSFATPDWRLKEIDRHYLHNEPFRQFEKNMGVFYGKRITVETDRLPAMAALASQIASLTGSQYLGGLWRDNLANDLLFSVQPYRGEMPFDERIRELSAPHSEARPSWSWAGHGQRFKSRPGSSLDSWIEPTEGWGIGCDVLDAVVKVHGTNPFGAVKHAHLSLRCRIIALEDLLRVTGQSATEPSTVLQMRHSKDLEALSLCWDTDNEAAPANMTANISFICTAQRPVWWTKHYRQAVAGLIIYPTGDGKFYRIGKWEEYRYCNIANSCINYIRQWESQTIKLL